MKGYLLALVAVVFVLSVTLPGVPQVLDSAYAAQAQAPAVKEVVKAEPVKVEAVKVEVAQEVPVPNYLDKLIEALKGAGGVVAGSLVVLEIALRLFPSIKPLSILVPVKYFVDGLAVILGLISQFLLSAINVANKSKEKLG